MTATRARTTPASSAVNEPLTGEFVVDLLAWDTDEPGRENWHHQLEHESRVLMHAEFAAAERLTLLRNQPAAIAEALVEAGWTTDGLHAFVSEQVQAWNPLYGGDMVSRWRILLDMAGFPRTTLQELAVVAARDGGIAGRHLEALRPWVDAGLAQIDQSGQERPWYERPGTRLLVYFPTVVWQAFRNTGPVTDSKSDRVRLLAWTRWLMETVTEQNIFKWNDGGGVDTQAGLEEHLKAVTACWRDAGIGADAVWWLLAGYSPGETQRVLAECPDGAVRDAAVAKVKATAMLR